MWIETRKLDRKNDRHGPSGFQNSPKPATVRRSGTWPRLLRWFAASWPQARSRRGPVLPLPTAGLLPQTQSCLTHQHLDISPNIFSGKPHPAPLSYGMKLALPHQGGQFGQRDVQPFGYLLPRKKCTAIAEKELIRHGHPQSLKPQARRRFCMNRARKRECSGRRVNENGRRHRAGRCRFLSICWPVSGSGLRLVLALALGPLRTRSSDGFAQAGHRLAKRGSQSENGPSVHRVRQSIGQGALHQVLLYSIAHQSQLRGNFLEPDRKMVRPIVATSLHKNLQSLGEWKGLFTVPRSFLNGEPLRQRIERLNN